MHDRTLFVRQAATLWQVKAPMQKQLTIQSGQAQDQVQVIDTLPVPWHFQQRLIRKVLAHTIGVFLNLRLGRSPLDLDGLVTA